MAADDVRERVHELLARAYSGRTDEAFDTDCNEWRQAWFDDTEGMVDVVLAYGDRIAREAAGKALRDAADECERTGNRWRNLIARNAAPFAYARWLRARAEAADGGPAT